MCDLLSGRIQRAKSGFQSLEPQWQALWHSEHSAKAPKRSRWLQAVAKDRWKGRPKIKASSQVKLKHMLWQNINFMDENGLRTTSPAFFGASFRSPGCILMIARLIATICVGPVCKPGRNPFKSSTENHFENHSDAAAQRCRTAR